MTRPTPQRSTTGRAPRTPARRRPARGNSAAPADATEDTAAVGRDDAERAAPDRGAKRRGRRNPAGRRNAIRRRAGRGDPPADRATRRPPPPAPHHLRRRRLALLAVVALLLAGAGATVRVLLYDSGLAEVDQVEVTGTLAVAPPDVLAAAAVDQGTPLAAVDVQAVAARVAALPGVARVDVIRDWPHTVEIAVTERVAVALTDSPQGLYLVDATGVAFRPAPEIPPPLPRLAFSGVGPDDPSTRAGLDVLAALPEPVRNQVQTVRVSPPANPGGSPSVTLGLGGDREVRWGSPDRSQQKATVLGPLLTQEGSVYDVASPELPTVRR